MFLIVAVGNFVLFSTSQAGIVQLYWLIEVLAFRIWSIVILICSQIFNAFGRALVFNVQLFEKLPKTFKIFSTGPVLNYSVSWVLVFVILLFCYSFNSSICRSIGDVFVLLVPIVDLFSGYLCWILF